MSNTKIINVTPHVINIIEGVTNESDANFSVNGTHFRNICSIPTSDHVARCIVENTKVATINNIPVVSPKFGEIIDMPSVETNTIIIASRIVAEAAKSAGRTDVFAVGQTIRDGSTIVGCINFVQP